jgi:hypothetical protein
VPALVINNTACGEGSVDGQFISYTVVVSGSDTIYYYILRCITIIVLSKERFTRRII